MQQTAIFLTIHFCLIELLEAAVICPNAFVGERGWENCISFANTRKNEIILSSESRNQYEAH